MRIGFVTGSVSRNAGGLHESVRRLAQSLASSASQVEVFGLDDEYTTADKPSWLPLKVRTFPVRGPRRFGFAPGLLPTLESSGMRLAMSHGLWMYPSVALHQWHEKTHRPYIVHPHGMLDPWAVQNSVFKKRLAAVLFENRHLQEAACIRALCNSEAESIRAYGLTNPIAVIPNGIDIPYNTEPPPSSVGPSSQCPTTNTHPLTDLKRAGRKVLLFLGRIHPKKGLVNLIKAWAEVQTGRRRTENAGPSQWTLAVAGWDQEGHEDELKRLATGLGLDWTDVRSLNAPPDTHHSSIVFLGPQFNEAKAACYRDCDAFILPSFSEGLPMAVLEAWAYRKPVLMTAACNLPDGFSAGAAIPIGTDVQGISDGLYKLLQASQSDTDTIGQRGRALVAEKFTWDKIAVQMRGIYEWVLGGGEKPNCVI